MTPDRFSTGPIPVEDQFEAWFEWYRPVLDITPLSALDRGFEAEIRLWRFGGFALSKTIGPAVRVVHDKGHLKRDPVDHWIISYCARAPHTTVTSGALLEVPAKVPFLWSLRQEFVHQRPRVDRAQLILSRDAFPDIAQLLDAACGSVLDTPLGHLLGDYICALEAHLPAVSPDASPRLAKAVEAMIAAAVAPSAERVATARHQIELGRRERVRQVVHRHLRTPTLTPGTLARLVGMSRSSLYRMYEGLGGVARYIQQQRLLAAQAILTDTRNTKSIAELVEEFCFADSSSFNRVFRREFGCTPGEARAAALAGCAPPIRPRRPPADGSDFGALLRGF